MNKDTLFRAIAETYHNLLDDLGIWVDACFSRFTGSKRIEIKAKPKEVRNVETVRVKEIGKTAEPDRSSADSRVMEPSGKETPRDIPENDILSAERQEIAAWLKKVKFKTKLFAGADEVDVWKKIAKLNELYDQALLAERARYDALLRQYMKNGEE